MSIKVLSLTAALVGSFAMAQPVLAHGDEDHGGAGQHEQVEHEHGSKATTAGEPIAELQASVKAIGSMIAAGNLDAVHEEVEKATVAIKAVKEQAATDGDQKRRLDASLKQFSGQLEKLHSASDSKDAERTKVEFKKVEGALKLVENAIINH